jgi:hypothetical protein
MPQTAVEEPEAPRQRGCFVPPLDEVASIAEYGAHDDAVAEDVAVPFAPGRPMTTAEDSLGTQHLRVHIIETADDRGPSFFRSAHVENMTSVLRAIARGQTGVLKQSGTEAPGSGNSSAKANLDLGTPLSLELLQEGDGAAETMLASTAAAHFMMLSRATAKLNTAITTERGPTTSKAAKDWSRTCGSLTRALAVSLTALEKVRSMRRNWDREVRLLRRQTDGGEVVDAELQRH